MVLKNRQSILYYILYICIQYCIYLVASSVVPSLSIVSLKVPVCALGPRITGRGVAGAEPGAPTPLGVRATSST